MVFGSCRYARPDAVADDDKFEADALDTYAKRMADAGPRSEWPDALLLLGDQVYADETSDRTQERIRARRDVSQEPGEQIKDFEEYTWLYEESWTDPDVRWLLSTIPSSMIFDDHDIADDWNTSAQWRADMKQTSWWQERVVGGLSSYWVYQHIGNLSPQALADDGLYQKVREHDGDCEPMLRDFATAADKEADGRKGAQWSYRRDLGDVRLLVIDSRCGRMLDEGDRSDDLRPRVQWVEAQVEGEYDHLLVGTSLPWLLARALHDIEAWNETLAAGPARAADGRHRREVPPGRRPRALGGLPQVLRPARRALRLRRPRRPRRLRRASRRRRCACCPATCTTRTPRRPTTTTTRSGRRSTS